MLQHGELFVQEMLYLLFLISEKFMGSITFYHDSTT